ncbi:MAG TPA: ribosomal protein S18-alanine N-acetyltransferase [Deltaproteobacteria bacterium]|jgi:ribosomal-protein-alanine N-acetyltransferase|nr:ribosomal protein S18-alanine N-acetyltransferase [Deltaproteobacteria bacterium]HQI02695.1 ribosomal protein S18-alanine N-acetyltransferase [Deltaproteobacteria bacterium]
MDAVAFRKTQRDDLPAILEIERLSFPSPWNLHTFISVLYDKDSYNLTVWCDGEIRGYCFTLVMRKMVHLLNLAVHPDCRRRGIARSLLEEIISFARSSNKSYVFLEVRKSNRIAQSLYASMGFSHAFTWRRYYTDTGEDAYIMVKKIERIGE